MYNSLIGITLFLFSQTFVVLIEKKKKKEKKETNLF